MKSPDINETHRTEGADAVRARHDRAQKYNPQEEPKQHGPKKEVGWREGTFTGAQLREMTFPPVSWIVPDIIPAEGVTLLCSKPKFGKSWLAYDLCIACTLGRFTLGEKKPAQGDVLYLALEDSKRRLRGRMAKLLRYSDHDTWPNKLTIKTEWRRLHEGGLDDIREWHRDTVAKHGGKPIMVVIDVLAKLRKPTGNKAAYEGDYEALAGLHKLANELGFSVLVIHHTRKMQSDDLMETVNGTFAITGAVDTILVMASKQGGAVLDIRGRDVESAELAIQFNKDTCKWTILGAAAEVHVSEQRSKIITALKDTNAPMTIKELVEATGLKRNPLELLLGRMIKEADPAIKRVGTGLYAHAGFTPPPEPEEPTSVGSVAPGRRKRQTKQRGQVIEFKRPSGDICRSIRSVGKGTSNGKPPAEEATPPEPVKTQTDQTDGQIESHRIENIQVSSDANLSGAQTDQTDRPGTPADLPPDYFRQQREAKAKAQRARSKARKLGRLSARVSVQEVRHPEP